MAVQHKTLHCQNLHGYLKTLTPGILDRLYNHPATCLAVFRCGAERHTRRDRVLNGPPVSLFPTESFLKWPATTSCGSSLWTVPYLRPSSAPGFHPSTSSNKRDLSAQRALSLISLRHQGALVSGPNPGGPASVAGRGHFRRSSRLVADPDFQEKPERSTNGRVGLIFFLPSASDD